MTIADFVEDYFELNPGESIKLHDYQKDILECEDDFRVVLKSRQIGITSVFSWEALAYAITIPNQTIIFVSASQKQANEILNYVKRILINLRRKQDIETVYETKRNIVFANGSRIISLPTSPNTIQGIRANRIYIDEFGIMDKDKEILSAILPSISLGGSVTIFSRPQGKRGEFYRIVKELRDGKTEGTLFVIPYTDCHYPGFQTMIENKIKPMMDEVQFKQNYLCEFVDESVSFFPYSLQLPCVDDNIKIPNKTMKLVMGVDFGRKHNSTVITIGEEVDNVFYVRQLKEFIGTKFSVQLGWINSKIKRLNFWNVFVDNYGMGEKLFEDLRDEHNMLIQPADFTQENKNTMIHHLRRLFEDKKIRIPRNEKMMAQLHALERASRGSRTSWRPGDTGEYGKHDDYVWSLAIAAWGHKKKRIPIFETSDMSIPEALSNQKEMLKREKI